MVISSPHNAGRELPDIDRLSIIIAVILLAFVLSRIIALPIWELSFTFLGSLFSFNIDIQVVIGIFVAALTATGADWLYRDHPMIAGQKVIAHGLLPALLALLISLALGQFPFNFYWWLALFLGGALLVLVLTGEYISIDAKDRRYPFATAVLTAGSFAIYLSIIAIARTAGLRLYLVLPVVFIATFLASLRVLHLRLLGEWLVYEALLVTFIVSQCAAAFHYWPVSPVEYGLLSLGPTYSLNSLLVNLIEEKGLRKSLIEPILALGIVIIATFILR